MKSQVEKELEEFLETKEVKVATFFGLIYLIEKMNLGGLFGFVGLFIILLALYILVSAWQIIILLLFAYLVCLAIKKEGSKCQQK